MDEFTKQKMLEVAESKPGNKKIAPIRGCESGAKFVDRSAEMRSRRNGPDMRLRYGAVGKLNRSNKSPMAGPFVGTYGSLDAVTGLGKLSRLRLVTGGKLQFLSMNLRMET
jgi:hypothetical protein